MRPVEVEPVDPEGVECVDQGDREGFDLGLLDAETLRLAVPGRVDGHDGPRTGQESDQRLEDVGTARRGVQHHQRRARTGPAVVDPAVSGIGVASLDLHPLRAPSRLLHGCQTFASTISNSSSLGPVTTIARPPYSGTSAGPASTEFPEATTRRHRPSISPVVWVNIATPR